MEAGSQDKEKDNKQTKFAEEIWKGKHGFQESLSETNKE